MPLRDAFRAQPWYPALGQRQRTFTEIVDYFEKASDLGLKQIIETGTARMAGNWTGDGQSTLIWDWIAKNIPGTRVLSIDIDHVAVKIAKSQTTNVDFHAGDSVEHLLQLPKEMIARVGLLYLDSLDWDFERGYISACHHLMEMTSIWESLPKGCMIAVDDAHGTHHGKHVAIQEFMNERNVKPKFFGYQIAWIKE